MLVFGLVSVFSLVIGGPVYAEDEPAYVSKTQCKICHNKTAEGKIWNPERYTLEDGTKTGFDFKQAWAKVAHGLRKDEAKAP